MEQWIDLAKGPLFGLTFLIMILGLMRLVIIQIYTLAIRKGRRLRNAPWKTIALDTASWIVPFKHLIKGTWFFSIVSYLSHLGVIIVPVFLADHIVLWEGFLHVSLPAVSRGIADYLTLFTIVCLFVLLGVRSFIPRQRVVSQPMDYVLLLMVLLPFVSGYLTSHPGVNPFPWNVTMLVHLLSAEALFVLIPFTKLAHIVLFIFDRVSAIHWQLRPSAGDQVAEALFGKEARV